MKSTTFAYDGFPIEVVYKDADAFKAKGEDYRNLFVFLDKEIRKISFTQDWIETWKNMRIMITFNGEIRAKARYSVATGKMNISDSRIMVAFTVRHSPIQTFDDAIHACSYVYGYIVSHCDAYKVEDDRDHEMFAFIQRFRNLYGIRESVRPTYLNKKLTFSAIQGSKSRPITAVPNINKLRQIVRREVAALRHDGVRRDIHVQFQLRPASGVSGWCYYDPQLPTLIVIHVPSTGTPYTVGEVERTIKHECGHVHHFALYPTSQHSNDWKPKDMEAYAEMYTEFRGTMTIQNSTAFRKRMKDKLFLIELVHRNAKLARRLQNKDAKTAKVAKATQATKDPS